MYPGMPNLKFCLHFSLPLLSHGTFCMTSFLYFCDCRLKPAVTFVFFITYFVYCALSRVSIENVDSRRLSLQMFSTANCGWLQGTGSITVTICFPLKWRKKSLLWSLWTVQDTGKYIANSGYQRSCWLKKTPNETHSASFACVIIKMATFSYSFCQEWFNYICCCLRALFTWDTDKCHVILPSQEWLQHYWGLFNFVAVQAFSL